MIDCLDKGIYCIAKKMLKKKNLISYRYILRRLYVMSRFPKILLENNFDRLVLVTNSTLFFVLKDKKLLKNMKTRRFITFIMKFVLCSDAKKKQLQLDV